MEKAESFTGCVVPGGIQDPLEATLALPVATSGEPPAVSSARSVPKTAWGTMGGSKAKDDSIPSTTEVEEFVVSDIKDNSMDENLGGYPAKGGGATSSGSRTGSRQGLGGSGPDAVLKDFDDGQSGAGSPTKVQDVDDQGFFGDGDEAIPLDLSSPSCSVPPLCVKTPEAKAPARVEISENLGWDPSAGASGQEECGATSSTHASMSEGQWDPAELCRVWIGAWNCQGKSVSRADLEALLPLKEARSSYDLYVLGTFACGRSTQSALISASKEKWERQVLEVLGNDYMVVGSQTLQSMHLVVYAASSIRHLLTNVATGILKTGFHSELDATVSNFLGKEGSVQICFDVGKTSMVFVYVHLPSKVEERDLRNQHILRIFEESPLKPKHWTAQQFVYLKKRVFVFGDLNYRLDKVTRPEVDKILKDAGNDVKDVAIPQLLEHDQLSNLLKRPKDLPSNASMLWSCFAEHEIGFAPTYKFDVAKPSEYDLSSNKRIPGWPVRILWKKSDDVICDGYDAKFQCKVSQHRPVVGDFRVRIDPSSGGGSTAWQESARDNKQSAVCTIS